MVREISASGHPPLYYFIEHFFLQINQSGIWVRMMPVLCGVLAVWLIFLTGRELFSRRAGILAATFAALSPFLIWHSADATDYTLLITISLASFYFLIRSVNRGGRIDWALYFVFTALGFYSHYYFTFMFLAEIPAYLVLRHRDRSVKPWLIVQAGLILSATPYLFFFDHGASQWVALTSPDLKALGSVLVGGCLVLLGGYRKNSDGAAAPIILSVKRMLFYCLILYLPLAIVTWKTIARRKFFNRKHLALSLVFAILSLGPALAQLIDNSFVGGRFLTMAAAPLIIMIGAILSTQSTKIMILAATSVAIGLLGLNLVQQTQTFHHDWRGLMSVISANAQRNDKILCFPLHHCLMAEDYYLGQPLSTFGGEIAGNQVFIEKAVQGYADMTFSSQPSNASELGAWLNENLSGAKRMWLVGGTGILGYYTRTTPIEKLLPKQWHLVYERQFDVLVVKLFERAD